MAKETSEQTLSVSGENGKVEPESGGIYSHWVLFVLVLVYIFNFID